jgi:2-hydroxy-6-oxonona-2,4-dienedioate hydrolase
MLVKFVDVDGILTRCLVAGDRTAPALILVHGLTLTADIWIRNIDELAEEFFVVAIDMLGHGFTRPPDGSVVTIPAKIEHLIRVADELGLDRFSISGSSYGALISAQLYLHHRDRLHRLILNGSGTCFNTEEQLAAAMNRTYENLKGRLSVMSPQAWRDEMVHSFYDAAAYPAEFFLILPLCYAQPWMERCWEETIGCLRDPAALRPYRILNRLEEFNIRTLVAWGREDPGGSYEGAVSATKRMPSAEIATFEKCGHMPMLEHPAEYNRRIKRFLNSP